MVALLLLSILASGLACGPGGGRNPTGGISNADYARLFFDNTDSRQYDSSIPDATARRISDLSCTFAAGERCAWGNYGPPNDQLEWQQGTSRNRQAVKKSELDPRCYTYRNLGETYCIPDINPTLSAEYQRLCILFRENCWGNYQNVKRKKRQASLSSLPRGEFLFAGRAVPGPRSDSAILATRILCQQGPGTLSIDQWNTNNVGILRVCTRDSNGARSCVRNFGRADAIRQSVQIVPPLDRRPFFIEIEATNSDIGAAVIDNIDYQATLCDGPTNNLTTINPGGGGGTPVGGCQNFGCDFNTGTTCNFNVKGRGSRSGQWKNGGGKLGNPSTGIRLEDPSDPAGQGYAYVGQNAGTVPGAVYVLESPRFEIPQDAELKFDLFRLSARPNVDVCFGDPTLGSNCGKYQLPRLTIADRDRPWRQDETVRIPRNVNKVYFVVKDLSNNEFIGLDRIRLEAPGSCTVYVNP